MFNNDKKTVLSKSDKSKIGSIDKPILDLCNKINSLDNYYTTSSCSGRIVLLEIDKQNKKQNSNWLFVSHVVTNEDLYKYLVSKKQVYFKFEPPIMHICSKTIEDAQYMLDKFREVGFKRGGIISTRKKIILEINSTEVIDVLVCESSHILISKEHLEVLLKDANNKLNRCHTKIDKVLKLLK